LHSRQDSLYWSLLYILVSLGKYELLYYSDEEQEAWLETNQLNDTTVIRLKRRDIDWSSWVRNDLESIEPNIKKLSRRGFRKKSAVYNVYISQWEPVDNWKDVIEDVQSAAETLFFTEDNIGKQVHFLQSILQLKEEEAATVFALQEEEPEMLRYWLAQVMKMRQSQQEQILSNAKPFVTKALIAVQVIMFFLMEWHGGSTNTATLIQFGAKYNPLILQGEWWRFITPIFLHIGFLHLLMNTVALYYIGSQVEQILGNVRFLFIYIFAGFCGSILSFVTSGSVSAGASGAIFGCFGTLLYIVLTYAKVFSKTVMQSVLTLIGINLLFGFIVPGIDNAGHIGGLAGGFLAAAMVHVPKQKSRWSKRAGAASLAVIFIGGLLWYGFWIYAKDPQMLLQSARESIRKHDTAIAERLLKRAVQIEDAPLEAHYLLGYVYGITNHILQAKEELEFVLSKKPDDDQSHYLLSLLYYRVNEIQKARQHAESAVQIRPNDTKYQELLKQLNQIKDEPGR
jgi:rhomboid protease GluP